jgi:hypothetical protein
MAIGIAAGLTGFFHAMGRLFWYVGAQAQWGF